MSDMKETITRIISEITTTLVSGDASKIEFRKLTGSEFLFNTKNAKMTTRSLVLGIPIIMYGNDTIFKFKDKKEFITAIIDAIGKQEYDNFICMLNLQYEFDISEYAKLGEEICQK